MILVKDYVEIQVIILDMPIIILGPALLASIIVKHVIIKHTADHAKPIIYYILAHIHANFNVESIMDILLMEIIVKHVFQTA